MYVVCVRDVTERRESEQAMREVKRAIDCSSITRPKPSWCSMRTQAASSM